jgi:predicted MFS family arabinose efflux permease
MRPPSQAALADYATMVGALLLARATEGAPLSHELLAAARARLLPGASPPQRPPAPQVQGSLNVFATPVAHWFGRRGIHFSWVVMGIAFLTMLTSSAALGLPGAFLQPLSKEFGWSTDQISGAIALRFVLYGLIGPFAAVLMERYGLRRIICSALLLIATGMVLATHMTALWQLVLLWGVVLGVGLGPHRAGAGRHRGQPLVRAAARPGDGHAHRQLGHRAAGLPADRRVADPEPRLAHGGDPGLHELPGRGRPRVLPAARPSEGAGLLPFGADPARVDPAPAAWRPGFAEPLRTLAMASRSGTFWVLFGTFFVCGLSTSGLIQTHFISLCGDYGLGAVPAASVLATIGACDFVGTIASGWLSDRYDVRKLLFWYYGLRGLSLMWLPHSTFTVVGLSLFAVFYGLDWVATVPPTVRLTSAAFDKQRAPMIFGWIFAGHQLGGAVAAYGAGLTRTVMQSYTPALYAAGLTCIVAAVAIFLLRRPPPIQAA